MPVLLSKRYTCDANGYCYYTNWDIWIRWVVLVVIIALFLLAFFLCSCTNARRRRRQGLPPRYGTGWTARPFTHNDPYWHNGNTNYYPPPPPQYSAAMPEGHKTYEARQYGGAQENGIELQQPGSAYAPGRSTYGAPDVYAPPSGPPPGKGDGIIR